MLQNIIVSYTWYTNLHLGQKSTRLNFKTLQCNLKEKKNPELYLICHLSFERRFVFPDFFLLFFFSLSTDMNGSFLFSVAHAFRLSNSKIQFTNSCNHQIFTLFTHLAVHVDSLSEGLVLINKHLSCFCYYRNRFHGPMAS